MAREKRKASERLSDRDKPLFMISVVSELLGVHPQTLRLYEREGFIRPRRTRGNTRLYSERDVDDVRRNAVADRVEASAKPVPHRGTCVNRKSRSPALRL